MQTNQVGASLTSTSIVQRHDGAIVLTGEALIHTLIYTSACTCRGGRSHIQDSAKRKAQLLQNQLVGNASELAIFSVLFGYGAGVFFDHKTSVLEKIRGSTKGDGFSDIPGFNVDVKSSLLKSGMSLERAKQKLSASCSDAEFVKTNGYIYCIVEFPDINTDYLELGPMESDKLIEFNKLRQGNKNLTFDEVIKLVPDYYSEVKTIIVHPVGWCTGAEFGTFNPKKHNIKLSNSKHILLMCELNPTNTFSPAQFRNQQPLLLSRRV